MRYKCYEDWEAWFIKKYGQEGLDYLLDSLFKNCQTLESIGRNFEVTRENIRLWRMRIRQFKPQFTTQKTQRKYCTILNRPNRIAKAEKAFIPSPAMAYCIERAKAEGFEVSLVWRRFRFSSKRLLINNKQFYISAIKGIWTFRNRSYYHFNVRLFDKARIVCIFKNDHFEAFIFPQGVLTQHRACFIPVDLYRPIYHGIMPKVDWKLYHEAWHLLKEEKVERS